MTPDDWATAFEGYFGMSPQQAATVLRALPELIDGEPIIGLGGDEIGRNPGLRQTITRLEVSMSRIEAGVAANTAGLAEVKKAVNGRSPRKFTGAQIAGFVTAIIASTTTIVVTIIQTAGG